jgi:hypothetical protein
MSDREERAPWWARPGARLAVLLVVLAGVAAYGVPRIVRQAAGRPGLAQCPPAMARTVPVSEPDMAAIWALAGGFRVTRLGYGFQDLDSAWTDAGPARRLGRADGYQLVWSTRDEVLSASVFAFRRAADATAVVSAVASTRCRGRARVFAVSSPRAGRVLVWTNPVLNLEADVFLARGNHVFRITDVPPHTWDRVPATVDVRRFAQTALRVACGLPEARCS